MKSSQSRPAAEMERSHFRRQGFQPSGGLCDRRQRGNRSNRECGSPQSFRQGSKVEIHWKRIPEPAGSPTAESVPWFVRKKYSGHPAQFV